MISIQNNREWKNFCEQVLEQPGLVDAPDYKDNVDRCANRPALDLEIAAVFSNVQRADLVQLLFQASIAFGSVNSVADLSQHEQLRRTAVVTPSGTVSLVAPPVVESGAEPSLGRVPSVGEHGAALRREFSRDA